MWTHVWRLRIGNWPLAVALTVVACSTAPGRRDTAPAPSSSIAGPRLTAQQSGTTRRLQAVSPVDSHVVWASGLGGTFVVTTDGGTTWRAAVVPGADSLEFRDVEGINASTAYLLAAGSGSASRIYKTTNGGRSWTLQFQNRNPQAFYDCFDFWTPSRGITFSDAAGGRFPVVRTENGATWEDIGTRMPEPLPAEAAFAASGTCLTTLGERQAWIATGGAPLARVFATADGGNSWRANETPLVAGQAAGGFTIAFRDSLNGILAGGTLDTANTRPNNRVAVTGNGGRSWQLVSPPPFAGAVFGLSYVPGAGRQIVVATGPGGAAWSANEGRSWSELKGIGDYWAVAFAGKSGWLVGTDGRILAVSFKDN
jgi:photosystem II stability/assembly factor-like uncharacterized protein